MKSYNIIHMKTSEKENPRSKNDTTRQRLYNTVLANSSRKYVFYFPDPRSISIFHGWISSGLVYQFDATAQEFHQNGWHTIKYTNLNAKWTFLRTKAVKSRGRLIKRCLQVAKKYSETFSETNYIRYVSLLPTYFFQDLHCVIFFIYILKSI